MKNISSDAAPLAALQRMGLTEAEAEVYAFLVRRSPATGYRIAQALSRPVGAVYKAVESLEEKGAVYTSEEEGNRVARAAPPEEFTERLRRRLNDDALALQSLADESDDEEPDDLLYRLRDRDAALERARTIIADARAFVIVNICPAILPELAPDLERAAQRIPIAVKVFEPASLKGVETILDPRGLRAVESGPGQWALIIADGRIFQHSLFSADGSELLAAHWSANPLLNWAMYSGACSHMSLSALRPMIERAEPAAALQVELERMRPFETSASFGKSMLISRHRTPSPSKRGRPRRNA